MCVCVYVCLCALVEGGGGGGDDGGHTIFMSQDTYLIHLQYCDSSPEEANRSVGENLKIKFLALLNQHAICKSIYYCFA